MKALEGLSLFGGVVMIGSMAFALLYVVVMFAVALVGSSYLTASIIVLPLVGMVVTALAGLAIFYTATCSRAIIVSWTMEHKSGRSS